MYPHTIIHTRRVHVERRARGSTPLIRRFNQSITAYAAERSLENAQSRLRAAFDTRAHMSKQQLSSLALIDSWQLALHGEYSICIHGNGAEYYPAAQSGAEIPWGQSRHGCVYKTDYTNADGITSTSQMRKTNFSSWNPLDSNKHCLKKLK